MFGNQVSIKDLFSSHPGSLRGSKCLSDSALEDSSQSNSQLPYSQVDFSDSQDVCSQQLSQGDSTQTSEPSKRRLYQCYNSKGPIFNKEGSHGKPQAQNPKQSYQQQLQNNKAKAKDRDERDLLNCMLTAVKECAAEVKTAVAAMKDNLEHSAIVTDDQLTKTLQKIQEGISRHNEEVLHALEIRENYNTDITRLKQELASKDSKIDELRSELLVLKEEQKHEVIDELQEASAHQHKQTQEHVHKLYKAHQVELQRQADIHKQNHMAAVQEAHKCHEQQLLHHNQSLRSFGQRIEGEIREIDGNYKRELHKLHLEVEGNLNDLRNKHRGEVEGLLKQQLLQFEAKNEARQSALFREQKNQLVRMLSQQEQVLQQTIEKQIEQCSEEQASQTKRFIEDLWAAEKDEATQEQTQQQLHWQQQLQHRNEKMLNDLKERHEKEKKELLAEHVSMKKGEEPSSRTRSDWNVTDCQTAAALPYCSSDDALPLAQHRVAPPHSTSHTDRIQNRSSSTCSSNNGNDEAYYNQPISNAAASKISSGDAYTSTGRPYIIEPYAANRSTASVVAPYDHLANGSRFVPTTGSSVVEKPSCALWGSGGMFSSADGERRVLRPTSSILSPLMAARNWTSQMLFSKKPLAVTSPVVSVLPQVKGVDATRVMQAGDEQDKQCTSSNMVRAGYLADCDSHVVTRHQPQSHTDTVTRHQPQSHTDSQHGEDSPHANKSTKKRRKKKSVFSTKKKKQRTAGYLEESQSLQKLQSHAESRREVPPHGEPHATAAALASVESATERTRLISKMPHSSSYRTAMLSQRSLSGAQNTASKDETRRIYEDFDASQRSSKTSQQGHQQDADKQQSETQSNLGAMLSPQGGHRSGMSQSNLGATLSPRGGHRSGMSHMLHADRTWIEQQVQAAVAKQDPNERWERACRINQQPHTIGQNRFSTNIISPHPIDEDQSPPTEEGSANSSPSLSVTEIFITRRFNQRQTSPNRAETPMQFAATPGHELSLRHDALSHLLSEDGGKVNQRASPNSVTLTKRQTSTTSVGGLKGRGSGRRQETNVISTEVMAMVRQLRSTSKQQAA